MTGRIELKSPSYLLYKEIHEIHDFEFEDKCNNFYNLLVSVPENFDFERMPRNEFESILLSDGHAANKIVCDEMNKTFAFMKIVTSYKCYSLFNCIIGLINNGDIYPSLSLLRTLTEVCCFFNYSVGKLPPLVTNINGSIYNFLIYHSTSDTIEQVTSTYIGGSKIESMVQRSAGVVEADNVLNSINSVSKKPKYLHMRANYDILCEYAHPNKFSNDFFAVITKLYDKESKILEKEGIMLIQGEADMYYRDTSTLTASIMTVRHMGTIVQVLRDNMELFEEAFHTLEGLKVEELKQSLQEHINSEKSI